MIAASFRVTTAWGGKRPGKRTRNVDVDTRDDAVLCALQWTLWSHARGRPKKFPRYTGFSIEEWDGTEWVTIREGTYEDAKAEYGAQDAALGEISSVQHIPIAGHKEGFTPRKYQAPRRNRGTSRLSNLISKVLQDI
jgi:anti-sigma factor ChrR (cupin superfamily)